MLKYNFVLINEICCKLFSLTPATKGLCDKISQQLFASLFITTK